jgi:hypothetical protein
MKNIKLFEQFINEARSAGRPTFKQSDVQYCVVYLGNKSDQSKVNYPFALKGETVKDFYGKDPLANNNDRSSHYIFETLDEANKEMKSLQSRLYDVNGKFRVLPIADINDDDNTVFVTPGSVKKALK